MKLAIAHPFLYTRGGAERVVLEIARHFKAKVFCSRYVPENTFPEFKDVDVEVLDSSVSEFIPNFLPVRIRDAVSAGVKFYNRKLEGFDVVNAHGTPSEWIRNKNTPVVWYCLHEDTLVLKRDRSMLLHAKVRDLKVGDYLPSFNNRSEVSFSIIRKIVKREVSTFNILRLRNGREMAVTPEHKFFVRKDNKWVVKRTLDMEVGDLVPTPCRIPRQSRYIKYIDVKASIRRMFWRHHYWRDKLFVSFDGSSIAVGNRKVVAIPSKIPVTKELMRFLGYYLAEGYTYLRHAEKRSDVQVLLTFGLHEKNTLVDDCVKCVRKVFGINVQPKERTSRGEWVITLPNVVGLFLQSLNCGGRAREKRIPDILFNVCREMQEEFIRAYSRGDGHEYVKEKRWRCNTVSLELANGLLYLLASTGKYGSIMRRYVHKFNNYRSRLDHQIYSVTYHADGFGYKKYKKLGDLLLIPLKEILTLKNKAVMYDIEVEGNHSFLAGDAIFTHNCHTPNREAFDLYQWRMSRRQLHQKALYWSMIQPYRLIESRLAPKIEFVFANSANTQNRLRKYLNVDSKVLNPCVDVKEFHTESYKKYFFYPSRITPEKRFEYAIAAFKEFRESHKSWKLVIAGALFRERPDHVAYYERIKTLLGGDGEILVDVSHEKLIELFSNCTAVVYTPVNEDFGIVPLEALASSKPCIAVNEGGPREVIRDGVNGFLVNSEAELADKMKVLSSDRSLVEKMGRAGRRHVEKNFSWKHFFEVFEDVCTKVGKKS